MWDIVALGELLIDFTEHGTSQHGQLLFEQNPGGAVANVLCGAAKLGLSTAFIGKVGDDMHGRFLKKTLKEYHVETAGLVMAKDVFTTMAFVALQNGEREFSFARKPGADTCLRREEVDRALVRGCRVFHAGSLSLTDEPARSATLFAVQEAKKSGAVVSFDPNYRAGLWRSRQEAGEQIRKILPFVDLLKLAEEEAALLTGSEDLASAAKRLGEYGIRCVVITLGKKGALIFCGGETVTVPTFTDAAVVDTTGAGDCFWASFLSCMIKNGGLDQLTCAGAAQYARFANAAASVCVGRRGAIPAMPTEEEIRALLDREKG